MSKSNLSLVGTGELAESVNKALVKLKLGRHELMFQDGEWIAGKITYIFKLLVCFLNPSITKFLEGRVLYLTQIPKLVIMSKD